MPQHQRTHLLAVNTQCLNRRGSSADQISHSFVTFVRDPYRCELASTK